MKHILAIIAKFAMTTIILELVLRYLTRLSTFDILLISLAVTVIAYIVGDLGILPFSSNTVATIADMGLAFATIYVFNYVFGRGLIPIRAAIFGALAIGVGEWFYHRLLIKSVFPSDIK